MASAKLIVARSFNELCVADISRPQLQSAAKSLKVLLKQSDMRSKDVLISNIAKALIEKGFIKVPAAKNVSRDDVKILKPF